MTDHEAPLKRYEVERLVDEKIKSAIKEYDEDLQKILVNMFIIKLSKFESAYGVGKFVVVAVALLVIGTLYQLFVTLAQSGVGK
ncbi:hypothetical protein QM806_04310 [Rhodococcus sp. IEGM 1351]|uniref:hypothetical protein n=1 Tax=Rhodococcus sp. IEGM 1351 TaxID=3047089 RepID=UPI0024B749F0|nr:hypothetical protein [Rhodococcus sp. IEGM 1351]MDI9934677.1 hypothetical protein [Rhodococcus sp. IEGM 1351]